MNTVKAAGWIFGVFGTVHVVRLFTGVEVIVGGYTVPVWWSGVAAAVAFGLAAWLFRSREKSLR